MKVIEYCMGGVGLNESVTDDAKFLHLYSQIWRPSTLNLKPETPMLNKTGPHSE